MIASMVSNTETQEERLQRLLDSRQFYIDEAINFLVHKKLPEANESIALAWDYHQCCLIDLASRKGVEYGPPKLMGD